MVSNFELIYYFNNLEVVLRIYKCHQFTIHEYIWVNNRDTLLKSNRIIFIPKVFKNLKKLAFIV